MSRGGLIQLLAFGAHDIYRSDALQKKYGFERGNKLNELYRKLDVESGKMIISLASAHSGCISYPDAVSNELTLEDLIKNYKEKCEDDLKQGLITDLDNITFEKIIYRKNKENNENEDGNEDKIKNENKENNENENEVKIKNEKNKNKENRNNEYINKILDSNRFLENITKGIELGIKSKLEN